jgi:hypothetical protein
MKTIEATSYRNYSKAMHPVHNTMVSRPLR